MVVPGSRVFGEHGKFALYSEAGTDGSVEQVWEMLFVCLVFLSPVTDEL